MADLSTMFNQLGPAGGSILAGVQMGNEANQQQSEQAMRQAQMDKIMQETAQAKLMNPLEVQAKQQSIAANDLQAKAAQGEFQQKALSDMIPKLEAVPEAGRHAAFIQMAHDAGLPMDQADLQHYAGMDAKDLVPHLKDAHNWAITQTAKYREEMAKQALANEGHIKAANIAAGASKYAADARAQLAKDRINADKSLSQDLSGAKNYQAQAVVYTNHAEKARLAGDDSEYYRLNELAKQATAQDLQAKAAAGDARAAQQMQLLQGLGVPMNNQPTPSVPGANPPALGTAANPIKLK